MQLYQTVEWSQVKTKWFFTLLIGAVVRAPTVIKRDFTNARDVPSPTHGSLIW